jgi:protein phosphatase
MGTTMTIVFKKGTNAYWVHVGDSRFYVYRGNKLEQITEDHTPPGFLLTDGEITKEQARIHPLRHVLFECLGYGEFEADSGTIDVMKGDLLLLSTDGLHDEVPETTIKSILGSNTGLQEKLQAFVSAALDTGGKDNITVVGVQV